MDPKLLTKLEADFTRVVPDDLNITDRYEASQCANTIRQYYLGHKPVTTENIDELIKVGRGQSVVECVHGWLVNP